MFATNRKRQANNARGVRRYLNYDAVRVIWSGRPPPNSFTVTRLPRAPCRHIRHYDDTTTPRNRRSCCTFVPAPVRLRVIVESSESFLYTSSVSDATSRFRVVILHSVLCSKNTNDHECKYRTRHSAFRRDRSDRKETNDSLYGSPTTRVGVVVILMISFSSVRYITI